MGNLTRWSVGVFQQAPGRWRRQPPALALLVVVLAQAFRPPGADSAPACPPGCVCQPGDTQVSCVGLTRVPRPLSRSTKVLRITHHRITKIDSSSFTGLEHLEKLEITRGRLSQISEDAFFNLTDLKKVNLSNNELTALPRDAFVRCLQLKRLDLSGNPLLLPDGGPMLDSESLAALDMSYCRLSELSKKVFSKLPGLNELRLVGNDLHQVPDCILNEMTLLDVDPTVQWINCRVQEATTNGIQWTGNQNDSQSGRVPCKPQSTNDSSIYLRTTTIPSSLPQWSIFVSLVLILGLWTRSFSKEGQELKKDTNNIPGSSETDPLTDRCSRDSSASQARPTPLESDSETGPLSGCVPNESGPEPSLQP